ncbi:MAG: DUF2848 family protein [Acidimicrobiales bacterium]
MPSTATDLDFVTTDGAQFTLRSPSLIVAGYTGREESSVQAHIEELAAIGVPPPETVPAFYTLESDLLTTCAEVEVAGTNTSGEAEPVILRHSGAYYLTVGSDHTDRDVERSSVADSKAACPKPLGHEVAPLSGPPSSWPWDALMISSNVDGAPYQHASLASIRQPADLLLRLEEVVGSVEGDMVLYTGTVPLLSGGFVPGRDWQLSLELSPTTTLTHRYVTTIRSI